MQDGDDSAPSHFTDPFKRWAVVQYRDRKGRMSIPMPGHVPYMQFMPTGITGDAGCNHFLFNFRLTGDRIEMSPVGTTLMECPDPPQLMEQEQDFLGCLSKASRLELMDEELLVFGSEGSLLIKFFKDPDWP